MNVLIVDDEPLARERLARMVGDLEGYRVLEPAASNGEEALALIDSLRPDVVLLDIRMPGMDGLQVAAKLCEREAPPAVIFCTAHDEFALEAFDVSAVGYLVKPVRPESLAAALKKAERPNRVQLAALTDDDGGSRTAEVVPLLPGRRFTVEPLLSPERMPSSENGALTSSGRFFVAAAGPPLYYILEVVRGPVRYETVTIVEDTECVFGGLVASGDALYSVCTGTGQGDAARSQLLHIAFDENDTPRVTRTFLEGTPGLTHYNGMEVGPDGSLYLSNSLAGFSQDPAVMRVRVRQTDPFVIEQTPYVQPDVLTARPNNGGLLFPNGLRILGDSLLLVRGVDVVEMPLLSTGTVQAVTPIYVGPGMPTIDDFTIAYGHMWLAIVNDWSVLSRTLAPSWLVVTDLEGTTERQIDLPFIPSSTTMTDGELFGPRALIVTSYFDGGLYRVVWSE